ncbi:MAG: hypothetical protein RIR53_1923 [Bacteroidota bacterium]|jgi:hypothetical protein
MRKLGYALLATLLFATSTTVFAQQEIGARATPLQPAKRSPRVYLGPVAGYNRSNHSSSFQSVAGDALCPTFTSGTENGYYVGLSFEYLLGKPRESKSSIIARAVYNTFPAAFDQGGDTLPSLNTETGEVFRSAIQHTADIQYSTVDIELIYKLNLFNSSFGVVVGPTAGFVVGSDRVQRMTIIDPDNATFDQLPGVEYENFGRTQITARDQVPGRAGMRLAIKAGVQYEIAVGRVLVVPSAAYNFGITKLSDADNIRVNALQVGVDIRFAL